MVSIAPLNLRMSNVYLESVQLKDIARTLAYHNVLQGNMGCGARKKEDFIKSTSEG